MEKRDILGRGNGSAVHGVLSNCKYPLMCLQHKIMLHTEQTIEVLRWESFLYEDTPLSSSWLMNGIKGLALKGNLETI